MARQQRVPMLSQGPQSPITSLSYWDDSLADINRLLQTHQTGHADQDFQGITKKHWKENRSRQKCANPKCSKVFSLIERPHHCRRCGDVFCNQCTQFRRRLNIIAHPDPQGKPQKVCEACFDKGPQSLGQATDLKRVFIAYRNSHKEMKERAQNGQVTSHFREKLNIHNEIERLTSGFKKSLEANKIKRVVHDVKDIVKTPNWLKSATFMQENMSKSCFYCRADFGVFRPKQNCALCGIVVCQQCSNKDMIVYVPDDERSNDKDALSVKLAVIRIIGSPEKEPNICQYLRVCQECRKSMVSLQVSEAEEERDTASNASSTDVWDTIISVSQKINTTKRKINSHLPQYQELIEALEISPGSAPRLPKSSGRSNVQVLAKGQCDLADHFTELVMTIHSLKKAKPNTKSQTTVLKNLVKSSCDFYSENMFLFRELRRKLETVTPTSILEAMQDVVEENAINSCYLSVKQLAFEALHLCKKHNLPNNIPVKIIHVEGIAEEALKQSVLRSGEDWTHHQKCMDELLQCQLKDHRLIRASVTLTKQYGSLHIQQILIERSDCVLRQIQLQLAAKSTDRSFKPVKGALEELHDTIMKMYDADVIVSVDDETDGKGKSKHSKGWLLI